MTALDTNSRSGAEKLAIYIVIAMILGIGFGWLVNTKAISVDMSYISLMSTLFLRAIKMIIAPLVFATLVLILLFRPTGLLGEQTSQKA